MKTIIPLAFLFLFISTTCTLRAQTILAQQTGYAGGYTSLANYTDPDPMMGMTLYQEVGQTFRSSGTTTLATIEFYVPSINASGTANMEIYNCSTQDTWGSLLQTKTAIAINTTGWVSVNVSALNIAVISGNYYGFKLIPQPGLDAGIGEGNVSYDDGAAWAYNGNGSQYFGGDYPFKITGAITLPVRMVSFTTRKQAQAVLLQWSTASEENTDLFIIQHSAEGNQWNDIGRVAASGNSNFIQQYEYLHKTPVAGNNYYRILQADLDGTRHFSAVRLQSFNKEGLSYFVLNNTVRDGLLKIKVNTAVRLSLYHADGRLLFEGGFTAGLQSLPLHGFSKGMYFLKGSEGMQKIIVQ